jgi:ABC-type lipoprotein release transport system permease subunit
MRLRYDPLSQKPGKLHKIVGVVGSVQHDALGGEPMWTCMFPTANRRRRTYAKPNWAREFRSLAEKTAWSIDPEQSVFDFASYNKRVADSVWQLRLSRLLLFLFGVVALVIAAIGVYGVMSYAVRQRTREVGVRLALGATPYSVQALMMESGIAISSFGLGLGVVGALGLSRWLHSLLSVVSGVDVMSLSISLLMLMATVLVACAVPALRASRLSPVEALRSE